MTKTILVLSRDHALFFSPKSSPGFNATMNHPAAKKRPGDLGIIYHNSFPGYGTSNQSFNYLCSGSAGHPGSLNERTFTSDRRLSIKYHYKDDPRKHQSGFSDYSLRCEIIPSFKISMARRPKLSFFLTPVKVRPGSKQILFKPPVDCFY